MAQTGFTPLQIYSSSTAAAAPTAGNLANSTLGSELAINITDGKLFYKDNANVVQVIGWKTVPTIAGGTGLTSYTAGDLLFYASGTALSKLAIGASGRYLSSSGSAPQWSAPGALTETDDTNVTLTLGGSPNSALLNAVSMTLGWTGTLAVSRGGIGTGTAGIAAFNNITGYTASGATGTTSTNLVFSTSPTLVTPNIGNATGTQLNIDNLRLDGNVISSQDTNGVVDLLPNGTGIVRATNSFVFRSAAQDATGRLAEYRVSVSTSAVAISAHNGTWGHLAIVTGLGGGGGDFFTDLVFSSATAGPTVLSAKTVSGSPAARTYSMSGTDFLQLTMSSGTYDVRTAILYGLS